MLPHYDKSIMAYYSTTKWSMSTKWSVFLVKFSKILEVFMKIGEHIKQLRLENKITQKELAKMLNISQQALSHYEKGEREINLDLLKKICVIFGVTSDELLEIETELQRKQL